MDLKREVLMTLHHKKRECVLQPVSVEYTETDDITTEDLLYFTINYLNGTFYDNLNEKEEALEHFENYIYDVDNLKIVNMRIQKIYTDLSSSDKISREDKIYMLGIKNKFKYDYIDWTCREWIIDLLVYFYVLSIESLYFLKLEMRLVNSRNTKKCEEIGVPVYNNNKVIKTDNNMKPSINCDVVSRKDLLVNRIVPTYTLEEFADKLVMNIKKYKETGNKTNDINNVESEEIEENVYKMREFDEFKDEKHYSKGNTDNVG